MLFTDTNSRAYEIKLEDVYEELFKRKHLFHFSNYPKESKFFGLKSNIFCMKNINCKESITAKGVNIATEFNEIKDTLSNKKVFKHKMRRIQDKKNMKWNIQNQQNTVINDKYFILNNEIHTIA